MAVTGARTVQLDVPDGFGAELDASTGDGHVRVRDLPFTGATDSDDRQSVRGRLGVGGGHVTIRTGDGSVVVRRSRASRDHGTR